MSEIPPVNFSQFVVSLASSVLVHLGEIAPPDGSASEVHLPLARHSLEVLRMLKVKTAGNLDEEEAGLLHAVLEDLEKKLAAQS